MPIGIRILKTTAFLLFVTAAFATQLAPTVIAANLINGGYISDAISVEGEVDTYTFSANAGDHVEIRMADTSAGSTITPSIELYGPSGGDAIAAGSGFYVADVTHTLTESGTYTVLAKDISPSQDGTGSYNLYFVKVPGANEHGALINDGVHAGTIDLGDLDTYTFSANAGDHVEIRMADTSAGSAITPRIELFGPSGGNAIAAGSGFYVADVTHTLTESGTYTVLAKDVSPSLNVTGSYDLFFVRVPGANEHGELINDGVHPGTIDLGDLDTYTFSANAGDHVEIRMADTSAGSTITPRIELFGPSGGNAITAGSGFYVADVTHTLTESGTYTVLAKDVSPSLNVTGSYDLYFVRTPGANEHGALINDGVHAGTIDLGDLDTYTFSANAGDHVEIRMADTSAGSAITPRIELFGPSGGNAIAAGSGFYVADVAYTLNESGTYTVLAKDVSPSLNVTGSYDLYFVRIPGANELGLLNDGETLPEFIDLGDLDTFTFIADVGESFDIQATDTSISGDLIPRIELYGPSGGNALKAGSGYEIASISHTVTEIGTYTLLMKNVSSGFNATGAYEITCATDGDNDIDGEDLYEFAIDLIAMTQPNADKDGNGVVDDEDVARFSREYGKN